jgi:hypothetical protein
MLAWLELFGCRSCSLALSHLFRLPLPPDLHLPRVQFFANKDSADSISEMLKYDQHGSFLEFMQNAMQKGEHEEYDGDKVRRAGLLV